MAPSPHTHIGGYQILGSVAHGSMGHVYRAWDASAGREVAIKLLTAAGVSSVERFRREGEIVGRLRHPGIVRVHAAGSVNATSHFLVYELVPGAHTLVEAWQDVELRQRVGWIRDVARAVGHAHSQGIVHRDIKPENVLVDAAGVAKVTDFGVATATNLERLTLSGAAVGTPTHMSPEQFSGSPVGPQTDVWALGVLLYEALCDVLPFEGGDLITQAALVASARVPPPRDVVDVPRDLERVCLAALRAEPSDRPANGEALAALLDDWLEGREVRVQGRRSGHRLRAALVLSLLGGAALALAMLPPRDPIPTPEADSPPPVLEPSPTLSSKPPPSLHEIKPGLERVRAVQRAEARLTSLQNPRERSALLARLQEATRRPLAILTLSELAPNSRCDSISSWGEDLLVRAGGGVARFSVERLERRGPWIPVPRGPLAVRDGQRAWVGRRLEELVARSDGGIDLRPLDPKPTKKPATAIASGAGTALCAKNKELYWERPGSVPTRIRLPHTGRRIALSPSNQRAALSCWDVQRSDYRITLDVWDRSEGEARLLLRVRFTSRVSVIRWLGESALLLGHLGGGVTHLDLPTKRSQNLISVAPGVIAKHGGVRALMGGGERPLLIASNNRLLALARDYQRRAEISWPDPEEEVESAVAHQGLVWAATDKGRVLVYSALWGEHTLR
jgi:serine/threonine protein kinase